MIKKIICEAFGTFCLVFAGTGAIVVNEITLGTITHIGISLTFGFIVLAMIYSIGEISGAHINPAVTLAFMLAGRFPRLIFFHICLHNLLELWLRVYLFG